MRKTIGTGALSLFLAVLLMGMAMVPAVSAESDDYTMAEGINGDIKGIFDNASALETLPLSLSPQAEQEYMENYVSPASMAITAMKAEGYSESQITDVLRENGYGWYPGTGACWKGRAPTPEEQKVVDQIRGPGYAPFPESQKNDSRSLNSLTSSLRGAGATLNLWNENTYFGINLYMSPGEMVVTPGGTFQHVVTTHVGKKKPSGEDDWTEAGVARSVNDPNRSYFTYDNDEGDQQHQPPQVRITPRMKIII